MACISGTLFLLYLIIFNVWIQVQNYVWSQAPNFEEEEKSEAHQSSQHNTFAGALLTKCNFFVTSFVILLIS